MLEGQGDAQADTLFAEIEAGIPGSRSTRTLASRGKTCGPATTLRVRRHVIYSMLVPSSIRIVRVLHARMDPDQNLQSDVVHFSRLAPWTATWLGESSRSSP